MNTDAENHNNTASASKDKVINKFCFFLPPLAEDGFLGQYSAVFNACDDVWTLSPGVSVPALKNFTVCISLKLNTTENSWTAFVYNKKELNGTPSGNTYELGLAGKHDKLTFWVFGNEITLAEGLDEHTWYQICIRWRSELQEVSLYINDQEKKTEKLSKVGELELHPNGQLLLGCSEMPGVSSPSPEGMVGELYMFRMWATADIDHMQDCQDGTIICWRKEHWIHNKTARYNNSLPCANAKKGRSRSQADPVTTPADSSIVTFLNYPNSATGTEFPENNVCNLAALCKDSIFYTGTMRFQTSDNSTDDSFKLKVHFSRDNTSEVTKLQMPFIQPSLQDLKISDFNSTLQRLSELSFMQCDAENQSTSDCSFIVKLDTRMNISRVLAYLQDKAFVGPIKLCCCSTTQLFSCPSTVKELQQLQCGMHKVTCAEHSSPGPPVSTYAASVMPSSTGTQPDTLSPKSITMSPPLLTTPTTHSPAPTQMKSTLLPFTKQTSVVLPSPPPTTSTIPVVLSTVPSFDVTTPVLSTVLSTKPATETSLANQPIIPTTEVSHTTSSAEPTTAVLPATSSPSSAMNSTFDMHSKTNSTGNPEQIFPNVTNGINSSSVETIIAEMERALSADKIEQKHAEEMVNTISKLLDNPQLQISSLSKRIIKIVDAIGLKLNFAAESIDLTSPSLALAVLKINSSFFNGVSFAVEDSSDLQVALGNQVPTNSVGAISLPSSITTNLSAKDRNLASRIIFNFYEKTTLFQDPSLNNASLISSVISSSVANLTVTNLKTNVTVTLKNTKPSQENMTVRCAFWDFTKNGGKGGWAYEGCMVKDRRTNETVCSCNHLTSFGVLLDLSRNTTLSPIQVLVLTFITYIGCGLSAIFLSVTLVTYIAFEKIRRDYPSKILIQLCVALLLLNLVFLLDSWIALHHIRGLCISVAVFLHYFLLVSFTWMGLEAFHMYLALVKVFNTYVRKYILKFCVVGWGVPALVVAIVLAIKPDNYGLESYGKFPNGSSDEFCWIKNNIVFYITVVGYFCIIFLLNISMFIVVLIQLCRIKKKKQLGAQRKTSIQDLRSVAGLTFLLGITWGFAFFAWGPVNLIFMYLFAIFNTLQGFFIFIFYCVAKENVRKQWRRYLCCGKYRLAENSDWSRTATNGLKKQNVNQGVSSSSNSLQSNSNSTNSTTMLMNNDYSVLAIGNGNITSEKNGVSFNVQNGDVRLHEFSGKQLAFQETDETDPKKSRITVRRTSKRGNLHFIEPM
ncbi:PREDICTED: adhesion G-protein coupled receptor G2 [Gekko japonicus]|uniref:Adhesion G-protein coupled receptor G2 n=1 Tax=Gekko japonicus TaxID=146911 RepID=A0ABM1KH88_GEKJA|nr:PREDICTED: adhesion G-protein coupled receptor G2 [Gekko japonicus]